MASFKSVQRLFSQRSYNCIHTRVARWLVFKPKNPNLGKFWRILHWKMLVYFMDTWSILRSFVIFYGHLVKLVVIWYIFSRFVPRQIWQPWPMYLHAFTNFSTLKHNHEKLCISPRNLLDDLQLWNEQLINCVFASLFSPWQAIPLKYLSRIPTLAKETFTYRETYIISPKILIRSCNSKFH
jgi:hypothetical protein